MEHSRSRRVEPLEAFRGASSEIDSGLPLANAVHDTAGTDRGIASFRPSTRTQRTPPSCPSRLLALVAGEDGADLPCPRVEGHGTDVVQRLRHPLLRDLL